MNKNYLPEKAIEGFIIQALAEDVGDGDHSSLAALPPDAMKRAKVLFKSSGVLAGEALARRVFSHLDPSVTITSHYQDGQWVEAGTVIMEIEGNARAILSAERLALNCMQRMSGIATLTRQMVNLLQGTSAVLLDTRKTTPNFRMMEKWAVSIGGGQNHRFGLYDMIMLKDNHIDFAGGITQAIQRAVDYLHQHQKNLKIEVEVRNLEELKEALQTQQVDVIMLDNMSVEDIKKAVEWVNGRCQLEASGGITKENIRSIAETGVDFISAGAVTHSALPLDISLKAF